MSQKLADKLNNSNLTTNDYWKILKQFITQPKSYHGIPTLHDNGKIISDETEKANLLNSFFQSQTQLNDNNKHLPDLNIDPNIPLLENITCSEDEVELMLRSLSSGKAVGPDNVNNTVLKELSHELASPLCFLFNKSLQSGKVPKNWKLAHVCAIHKKDDPTVVSNYRPISLLSTISKVLEKIIHKHMFNFFLESHTITP